MRIERPRVENADNTLVQTRVQRPLLRQESSSVLSGSGMSILCLLADAFRNKR